MRSRDSKEPKLVHIEHPGEKFWEQIEVDGVHKYAFYRPPNKISNKENVDIDTFNPGPEVDENTTIHYYPLSRCPWSLAGIPLEPGPDIWTEVNGFIYRHIDLPDQRLYDVLTAWVFCTWIIESWSSVPYLQLLGPKNSGKTRLLEVLRALSYRGMMSANISEAALFRAVEAYKPTLLLDEAEIYLDKDKATIQNLLNAGYRRGLYAIRIGGIEEKQPRLDLFEVFGFKAISGVTGFKDTLESRAIRINMEKNTRPVEFFVDEKTAKNLRSRLLLWRFRRLYDRSEGSEGSEGYTGGIPEDLAFADGRFAELYTPLVVVANHGEKAIISYARDQFDVLLDEEGTTVEAQILEIIIDSKNKLESGKFSTASIAETFNNERSDREKWKVESLGRVIKRLGFRTKRMTGGRSGWVYDEERVKRLAKRYGLPPPKPSLLPLPSLKQELEEHPICMDCGQPINDGSNILWEGRDRVCSRCATFRKKMREES